VPKEGDLFQASVLPGKPGARILGKKNKIRGGRLRGNLSLFQKLEMKDSRKRRYLSKGRRQLERIFVQTRKVLVRSQKTGYISHQSYPRDVLYSDWGGGKPRRAAHLIKKEEKKAKGSSSRPEVRREGSGGGGAYSEGKIRAASFQKKIQGGIGEILQVRTIAKTRYSRELVLQGGGYLAVWAKDQRLRRKTSIRKNTYAQGRRRSSLKGERKKILAWGKRAGLWAFGFKKKS